MYTTMLHPRGFVAALLAALALCAFAPALAGRRSSGGSVTCPPWTIKSGWGYWVRCIPCGGIKGRHACAAPRARPPLRLPAPPSDHALAAQTLIMRPEPARAATQKRSLPVRYADPVCASGYVHIGKYCYKQKVGCLRVYRKGCCDLSDGTCDKNKFCDRHTDECTAPKAECHDDDDYCVAVVKTLYGSSRSVRSPGRCSEDNKSCLPLEHCPCNDPDRACHHGRCFCARPTPLSAGVVRH